MGCGDEGKRYLTESPFKSLCTGDILCLIPCKESASIVQGCRLWGFRALCCGALASKDLGPSGLASVIAAAPTVSPTDLRPKTRWRPQLDGVPECAVIDEGNATSPGTSTSSRPLARLHRAVHRGTSSAASCSGPPE